MSLNSLTVTWFISPLIRSQYHAHRAIKQFKCRTTTKAKQIATMPLDLVSKQFGSEWVSERSSHKRITITAAPTAAGRLDNIRRVHSRRVLNHNSCVPAGFSTAALLHYKCSRCHSCVRSRRSTCDWSGWHWSQKNQHTKSCSGVRSFEASTRHWEWSVSLVQH